MTINSGTIDTSWTSAAVNAGFGREGSVSFAYGNAGGFVSSNSGTIRHAYVLGEVISNFMSEALGFVRTNGESGTIEQVYTLARLGCGGHDCQFRGAFIGTGCPNGAADYWDSTNFQGSYDCTGLAGLSDGELKAQLPAGFDPAVWGQDAAINSGYPYLLANPPQ